jgi:hypothetical protein
MCSSASRIAQIRPQGTGKKSEETEMKILALAALFALALTMVVPLPASAAAIGNGISKAAKASSLIEDVYCRSRRICHRGAYGYYHCHWRHYCW